MCSPDLYAYYDQHWFYLFKTLDFLSSQEFLTGLSIGILLFFGLSIYWYRRKYRISKVKINIPFELGTITYEATNEDRELAWKMYVQLKTRKAALPFDEENDVIVELLDSLFEIFSITREILAESKPYLSNDHKNVSDFVIRVLNDGVRPTLTRWQSVYRKWWGQEIRQTRNHRKTPQAVQKKFPKYKKMVADLKRMNNDLSKFAEELLKIVHSAKGGVNEKNKQERPVAPDQK